MNASIFDLDSAQALVSMLHQWDKQEIIDYAVKLTKAMSEERNHYTHLSKRYVTAKLWAQGLTLVEEIGQNLTATLDLNEVLRRLLKRVNETIGVEDSSILLREEPSGDLVFQVVVGQLGHSVEPFRVPRGQGIAGEVALTGIPVIVNNAQEDNRHFKKIDQDTGFFTRSILCVPLIARKRIVGVVEAFNKESGPFTRDDQIVLGSIANYAAIAIENAQLHQNVVDDRDRILQAQEEISHRLQRDLHDGPTQLIAAVQMSIDFCQKALQHDPDRVGPELAYMQELVQRANHQMRTMLFELRPLVLETYGLVKALKTFVERRQQDEQTIKFHFSYQSDNSDGEISRLHTKSEAAIFAIVQEMVNNTLKHAQADHIFIRLLQEKDLLRLIILDDGLGFDARNVLQRSIEQGSFGMLNLQERVDLLAGKYALKSAIGAGAELSIEIPLLENLPTTNLPA